MIDDINLKKKYYFEDFSIGDQIYTVGRTITESDISQFAGLSADYNQIHTDEEYAKRSIFGTRVAHGLLILSIVSGLAVRTGVLEDTVIAFREIKDWKFAKPVFIGDTVRAVLEITSKKTISRLNGGSVNIKLSVFNQDDEQVMKGNWSILIKSKL